MRDKHVHTYVLEKTKRSEIYKCMECPHYKMPETVIGCLARCKSCGNEFIMTKALRGLDRLRKNPHCGCRFNSFSLKKKDEKTVKNLGKLEDLIGGLK